MLFPSIFRVRSSVHLLFLENFSSFEAEKWVFIYSIPALNIASGVYDLWPSVLMNIVIQWYSWDAFKQWAAFDHMCAICFRIKELTVLWFSAYFGKMCAIASSKNVQLLHPTNYKYSPASTRKPFTSRKNVHKKSWVHETKLCKQLASYYFFLSELNNITLSWPNMNQYEQLFSFSILFAFNTYKKIKKLSLIV